MAYVMSEEMRARIEADAKKMKSEKPFPQRAKETKYAGTVKQTETQQEEKPAALIKKTSQDGSYKMSSGMVKRIREDAGRFKSTGSFTAAPEEEIPLPGVYRSQENVLAPYKTYYQPTDGGEAGKGIQMTKEFSKQRLRDEAYSLYKDYGGKSYNDIQAAADSETGTDFMSRYRKDVLTQIALDAEDAPAPVVRTRDDIVNDIAATDAELEILYGEADTSRGDPWKMTDIKNRASALEGQKEQYEQELYMYDQGQMYSAIPGYSDYAKNSGFTGEGKGTTYNFINNVNGIRGTMAAQGILYGGYGKYAPYEHMTQEEINTYNYLYNVSGKDAAERYLEYLEYDLNRRLQEANYGVMYDYASGNFGKAAGASIASILTNLGSGIGYLDVVGQKIAKNATGSEKPIDYNRRAQTGYYITQGAREGAMSDMSETGKTIYNQAMSMADSLAVLGISVLTGGAGATMLLGGSTATSTMHEAKKFGASDKQALALGFVAGAAETVMEKLPLDAVLNIGAGEGFKATVKNILKQGFTEATEEVLTTLANTVADVIIMGDKDILARSYESYIAQGYAPEEAQGLAEKEWVMGLVGDALGGFISGAAFGLGGTVVQNTRKNKDRRAKGKAISTSEYTLPLLIEHVENGYTDETTGDTAQYSEETKKTAAEIKKTLEDGKAVSNAKKGKLAEQVLKDNAAFEKTELPKILQQAQEKEDAAEAERTATEKEEAQPEEKAGVVDKIKSRLSSRKEAADSGKAVEPEAAKVLAEEVLASESTYSKKTKAAAQKVLDGETVSDADAAALVKGIQKDVPEFSGYEVQEILAEASIAAQERTENKQGREMSEKTKTAEPQTAAQQTAKEGVNADEQTGRTERNDEGDTARDTVRSDGGRGRFSDTYSGDGAPAQSRNRRDVRSEAHRTQTASERQRNVAALRVEPISAADIGVKNGSSEKTMYVMPEEAYDEELRSLQADAEENGIELHFFTGFMEVNGRYVEAEITGNAVYVKADGQSRTASELYDHEKFHKTFRGKAKMVEALAKWIKANYTRKTFDDIFDTYYDKYNAAYDLDNMSEAEATRLVMEEILADAFAGVNKFGVQASAYTDVARAAAEETGGAKPSEYNENRGRGPPDGMTYDSIKQAVREVLGETAEATKNRMPEAVSEAQNQQGLNMKEEALFSIANDTAYMDDAIAVNKSLSRVDDKIMASAKTLREKIATRMLDIKDRGLVGIPDDIEGNTYIANSSYDGTEENTTICPRSLAAEAFTDAVSEYLGRPLTVEEQIYISQDLQGRSLTPECTYCYVATDRKAYRAFLGEYIAQRDAVLDKLSQNPNADVSRGGELYKDFLNGRKDTNSMYNRFKMWVDAYKNGTPMVEASHLANISKLMGDINSEFGAELKPQITDAMKYAQSASWAKKRINYVAYNGHILKWKQDRINKLNSHYGLRMYSFSDFHPAFVLENMQMITDASVRGLKMLGYTKDTDFVEIFAPSGMNINVSTFGFETDGNVYENNIIGAEWAKAQELRAKYPNVGVTFVATNDKLVEWALDQEWIDVVIPYHLVRTGAEVAKAFKYTNYTNESADTKKNEWKKGNKKSIAPTEHDNDKATYLAALDKNNLEPRFKRFIDNPNYMKLVNECRQPASVSKPVQPVFNEDAAMRALAKLEANGYYQPVGGSVDRMYEIAAEVGEQLSSRPAQMYSISDDDYDYDYDIAPEDRSWEDAGNRKIESYAYAHPELREFYKKAARDMWSDLDNSVKGERWGVKDKDGYYIGGAGTTRSTTENIARLLDNGNMTYKRIREALLTILYKTDDAKLMNKADVKKVEMELDTMLQEGYVDPTGLEIEPNREYRLLLDAVKEGYDNIEDAEAAWSAEARDSDYDAAEAAAADVRADAMYKQALQDPDISLYEDIAQEERDALGEIVDSADEMRLQRMAAEREAAAAELSEADERVRMAEIERRENVDAYFDAFNQEELDEERRRMDAVMQKALQNPDIENAPDTAAEHWESITAQIVEEKRRELKSEAIAKINELDAYMPDDVSAEEILAAQELHKQKLAERKALEDAKYEGLTAEEAEAAREADAKAAKAEYLEGAAKKNFVGSEGLNKLGIKIANSIANYKSSKGLWDRAKANAALVRSVEREIRKMHPSTEEEYFANGIINNNISETSIPRHIDVERVLDLVDLKIARNAGRTDLLAAQKADINNRNRELASEKFKNAERAKPVKLLHLNYMTPRRAMIEMFGAEQGEEIYRTFFAPVRTNDAERIRFAERMRQGALEIVGADGKKGKLTKEERAVTQMLMEGKAAQGMLVQLEGGSRERIEEAVKKILKGEKIHDEKTVYVVGEENGTELSGKEMDVAMRTAAQRKAREALDNGVFNKKKIDATRVTNAAKHFEEQYNLMYDAINEFLVAHGEEPIGFIKGYAPHTQPESAQRPIERLLAFMNAPTDITELRAEIAGETHLRKPNRKWNPHFLSRGFNAETEYDAYAGFEEYVDYISEVFYHMDDIMRLRAASRYLRTQYTTEASKELLKQIEDIRNGSYFEKMNFLAANNRIGYGERLIGAEIDAKLDEYVDKILNEKENETAVSSSLVMWLDNYTNLLAGKQNAMDRGLEQTAGRKGIRALNKAVNRLISAQVVGNISSALNQTAQLPFTITELGADNVAKALWDLTRNYKEMRRWSLDNDFLRARKGTTVLNYDIAGKLTQGLAKPLEISDWLMSQLTARAAYHQALKQGMGAKSAMEYSVQKAEDIMGSRNKASKPVAFSTKRPMMRLVNAYQIEVLNQWEHIVKDLPREYKAIAKSRGKLAAAGRIAKDLVVYLILAALINRVAEETYGGTPAPLDLFGIIGNFVAAGHGLTLNEGIVRVFNNMVGRELLPEDHTFDSQMPEEFDWGAAWEDTGYTLSSEVPFLNNVLAVAGLTDDKTVFAAGFADARKSFGKAIDHFFVTDEEREKGEQESAEVLDGLYDVIMGVSEFVMGGRQIQKTLQGITTVAGHGEKDNKGKLMYPVENTVGNWLKGTLFGKNALKNSRAYYASGASPLNSTRNEQYFGMVERGVDEEEAYRIAQEIYYTEADYDENGEAVSNTQLYNRLEYIDGLDISEDAKQYLISALYNDLDDDSKSKESFNALTELGVSENDASKITTELYSMTADVDEDGEKVSGSKFMNQMEYVMNLKAPDDVKDYLALSIASDAAYKRYEERGLEKAGVDPAEFMLGWAFYQSATGKDKLGQTEKFLKQQGVSEKEISIIVKNLK